MFKKFLSSLGVGGATVDARLDSTVLLPGERFSGHVLVNGGDTRQVIEGLELAVVTRVEVESGEDEFLGNHILQSFKLASEFIVQPNSQQVFPFEAILHPEAPVTEVNCRGNRTQVWLQTGLAIDMAKDASDRDHLRIAPTSAMQAFLDAMESCGFAMHTVDVEKGFLTANNFRSRSGCYQEFEFKPIGHGYGQLQEVEVSFVPEDDRTHVLLEIDRAFRDDTYRALTIDHRRIDQASLVNRIREIVGTPSAKPMKI